MSGTAAVAANRHLCGERLGGEGQRLSRGACPAGDWLARIDHDRCFRRESDLIGY
jgi:hypothetical protein